MREGLAGIVGGGGVLSDVSAIDERAGGGVVDGVMGEVAAEGGVEEGAVFEDGGGAAVVLVGEVVLGAGEDAMHGDKI